MHNKVILNYMPPRVLVTPSLEMSILKSFLNNYNIDTNVIYWNFKLARLQNAFLWADNFNIIKEENDFLYLYTNYLAIKNNNKEAYINIKAKLISIKPNYITSSIAFYDKHMRLYAEKLDMLIDEFISEIYSPNILCFGFSVNLSQWLCSTIIAKKIKLHYPKSKIIVFEVANREAAVSYLNNFDQFDFAIWGEPENIFLNLCNLLLDGKTEYENVCNLAFRQDNNKVVASKNRKVLNPSNLNQFIQPDYSDYFEQKKLYKEFSAINSIIGIEVYRGNQYCQCHSYCQSVDNNKFKPINTLVNEIKVSINKYDIYEFSFPYHDLTSYDNNNFDKLVEALAEVKQQFPEFKIDLVNITTSNINAATIGKMMVAGFDRIQIDYEAASEGLLKKIENKSTFASNLLFLKYADLYQITVCPANITMGFPQETSEDILQTIHNLHYLRFFLKEGYFIHRISKLEVMHPCKYHKIIDKMSAGWVKKNIWNQYLPQCYLKEGDDDDDIIHITPMKVNPMWNDFIQTEAYYIQNKFEYKLFKMNDKVLYKEFFNSVVVSEFELSLLDWIILETANERIVNIKTLLDVINNKLEEEFLEIEIINVLEDLKSERLLYISDDYSEIVSIVNTKLVI